METKRKFDVAPETLVTVNFAGQMIEGRTITWWRGTEAQQIMVEFAVGGVRYTQPYSRKTGKFYGGTSSPELKRSFLTEAK